MILIPAWVIVFLTALVAVDSVLRYRDEKNLLLLGKSLSWGMAMFVYLFIALDLWGINDARAFSRLVWMFVPLTELAYRYAKAKWRI